MYDALARSVQNENTLSIHNKEKLHVNNKHTAQALSTTIVNVSWRRTWSQCVWWENKGGERAW